jgi:uncharacterized protein YukE
MAITVDNDPDAIQRYRGQIQNAIEQLKEQLSNTEQAIRTVSESWKDNNFIEFQANFNVDKEQIKPLCSILDNYQDNILYQLEQKLRTYIGGPTHL